MDGRVTLRDDPQTFELAKKFWRKKRTCKYCNRRFTLLESFGKWNCRIHTGVKKRVEVNDMIGSGSFRRQKYPRGKIEMSCCNEIVSATSAYPGVVDLMVCRPALPLRNGNIAAKTVWTGNISAGKMADHTARARRAATYTPEGCTRCDCRDTTAKWEVPIKVDGKYTEASSVVNIQDFAPILALMSDVEERPAFQNIDADGNVARIDKFTEQNTDETEGTSD